MQRVSLKVKGMSCAACSARIEKGLSRLPGVNHAQVNLALEQASVEYDPEVLAVSGLVEQIERLGFTVPTEKIELKIKGMACAACVGPGSKKG